MDTLKVSTERPFVYKSTIDVVSKTSCTRTLPQFNKAIKYAWCKIQTEITRYWQNRKIKSEKVHLNEDARLSITAYVLVQAGVSSIVPQLYAMQDFINDQLYEECAPMTTLESAIKVVRFEFEDIVNGKSFMSNNFPQIIRE